MKLDPRLMKVYRTEPYIVRGVIGVMRAWGFDRTDNPEVRSYILHRGDSLLYMVTIPFQEEDRRLKRHILSAIDDEERIWAEKNRLKRLA